MTHKEENTNDSVEPTYSEISEHDGSLAIAESELKRMKPEDLLQMKLYIESLERNLPEAGGVVWGSVYSRSGQEIRITIRGANGIAALNEYYATVSYGMEKFGMKLSPTNTSPVQVKSTQSTPVVTSNVQHPVVQQAQPTEIQQSISVVESGTHVLNSITYVPGKPLEFSVGKFKYPFKDSRELDAIVNLFDEGLGFTKEHFGQAPALYTSQNWGGGNIYVDWEKIQKPGKEGKMVSYWNIKKIHA